MSDSKRPLVDEVMIAINACGDRIEPYCDILIRLHDGKVTVVEVTTRHKTTK